MAWDEFDPETGQPTDGGPASYEVWDRPIVSPRAENADWPPSDQRVAALRAMAYADYLLTPEWKRTRRFAITAAEYRCQRCQRRTLRLDVHHLTYERLGHEDLMVDLEVLCRACHAKEHGVS